MAVVKGWKEELCLVKHLLCLKTQTVPYPPLIILSQIQTIISRLVQGPPEKKNKKTQKPTNQNHFKWKDREKRCTWGRAGGLKAYRAMGVSMETCSMPTVCKASPWTSQLTMKF